MKLVGNIHMVGAGVWGGMGLSPGPDCNTYMVDCGDELVLIDCGSGVGASVETMLANIAAEGLSPERISTILLTHKHGDHVGGAAQFSTHTGAAFYGSAETAAVLASGDEETSSIAAAKAAGLYAKDFVLAPVAGVRVLEPGARLSVGPVEFEAIETPGHCSGHLSFVARQQGRIDLFAGDAIFWRGRVVLQALPDCDVIATARSIERLGALGRIDGLFPGHGAFTIAGAERHIAAALEQVRALRVPPAL